jgi:hypothetical protein
MDFMAVELRDGLTVGGASAKKEFTQRSSERADKKIQFSFVTGKFGAINFDHVIQATHFKGRAEPP